MKSQDPVLGALNALKADLPEKIQPLIDAYETNGVEGLDESWRQQIKDIVNED